MVVAAGHGLNGIAGSVRVDFCGAPEKGDRRYGVRGCESKTCTAAGASLIQSAIWSSLRFNARMCHPQQDWLGLLEG